MKDLILKYSLINAIEHEGMADMQAVLGKIIAEKPEMKEKIGEIVPEIKRIIEMVNSLNVGEQKKRLDKLGIVIEKKEIEETALPELHNAVKGKVVMRFAPFPSGPLHIGNTRTLIMNDEYAKKYNGKLLLVIDDTIGSKEKFILPEAYKMIKDGVNWLGVKYYKTIYKSDRIKIFYSVAQELIKKDAAYVCKCNMETLRKNRYEGVECKHRSQTVKENLKKFDKMLKGKYGEGKATLRLKTDMKDPDPAFRDRVLMRIAIRKHPRVGNKYKVWPTLEFSWAVDNHMLGITHVLRGKDLMIEDRMEEFIWNIMGWNKIEIVHHGMLKLEGLKLSKTESRIEIEKKKYSGWDDPRTWSLQSLEKRGMQPEAIRKFCIKMGMSLSDVSVPLDILYAENRKLIDPLANRYFAVLDPVQISIKGKLKPTKINMHPDFPKRGSRTIPVDNNKIYIEREDFDKFHGKEIGLMNLCSVKLNRNSEITSKDVKYEIQKIHWVSEPNVKIKIIMPNGAVKKGLGDPGMKKVKVGDIIQLQRIGFCRVEKLGIERVLYFAHK
jgi:glutamyl-tRNA synthetase